MGTDVSDPIGGSRPPAPPPKKKTISAPYQSYQIRVSVANLTELVSVQGAVDGAPTFVKDHNEPWFWFALLPAGLVSSADGSSGAIPGTHGGFYVGLTALLLIINPIVPVLGSFASVARASAKRLLDTPLATLQVLGDGAETYVGTLRSGWHWEAQFPAATATDNITTCRPTAWIATGFSGAFVRNLGGDFTWRSQGIWNINSTAADNEGDGSLGDPLQSDGELVRRWGPSASLPVPITVSYAQSPPTVFNFDVYVAPGGSLVFQGPRVTTQVVLTGVSVQSRTPGSEQAWALQAPGVGAANVGQIAMIADSATPANIGAYARVLKDNTGNSIRTTPFGTASLVPNTWTVVTPQIGDTVQFFTPITLKTGTAVFRTADNATPTASPLTNLVNFDSILFDGNTGQNGNISSFGVPIIYTRCIGKSLSLGGPGRGGTGFHYWRSGGCDTVLNLLPGATCQFSSFGALATVQLFTGSAATFLNDCYWQNARPNLGTACAVFSLGCAFWDRATSNSSAVVTPGCTWLQQGAVPDWGTGNAGHGVTVMSTGNYSFTTKPTINGTLGPGREAQVGGSDKQYGAVPYVEGANNAALVLTA